MLGSLTCFLVGLKGIQDGKPGHDVEHLEEPLPLVGAAVRCFIESRIREGEEVLGEPLQGPAPLQQDALGIGDMMHLDALTVRHVRRIGRVEHGQITTRQQSKPEFVEQCPGGIHEKPCVMAAAEGLLGIRERGLQRHAPQTDRPGKHHADLGPDRRVVQAFVQAQGQEAEVVGRTVLFLDGTEEHGRVHYVGVG